MGTNGVEPFYTNRFHHYVNLGVCRQHGDADIMVLNVDGGPRTNSCKTNFNGLVMNHEGSFQIAFYGSVAVLKVLHVEIKVLLVGIKLCWQVSFESNCVFQTFCMW